MIRIFYIQIIYNAALIPVFYIILKETRGDVILAKRAKKLRKDTGKEIYAKSELEKTSVLKMLKIPSGLRLSGITSTVKSSLLPVRSIED